MSLSLQSIASLANKYEIGPQDAAERLASFFVSVGCDQVYDINLARHLALIESYREFRSHKQRAKHDTGPLISSVCPGWVCYAEKTNGELIIPHLSRVRSPQQIMGALLKQRALRRGKSRADVYHVTLMPCFDKKLEASRQEFKDEGTGVSDVDCVLTPVELEEILRDEGVTLLDFERRRLDVLVETGLSFDKPLTSHFGSVSGGYAENILLAYMCQELDEDSKKRLQYTTLRNNDFTEITIKHSDGGEGDAPENSQALARFAIINGFRNIQTVVQRLKRGALKYDYIEIMACPSGCINGGAQCRPAHDDQDSQSTSKSAQEVYKQVPAVDLNLRLDALNSSIYEKLDLKDEGQLNQMIYTSFRPVPKMQSVNVSW